MKPTKPSWLKIRAPKPGALDELRKNFHPKRLHTVCEEAHCPNMAECWSGGTATFMVLGEICTRGCRFCAIKTAAKGADLDPFEPRKLVDAVKQMNLSYIVITSVDRDDLPDQGAEHFAKCVRALKKAYPDLIVELLIPDFQGNVELLRVVVESGAEVIGHNIETVKRLQSPETPPLERVRDARANYEQSMKILASIKAIDSTRLSKSAIMVGFGETEDEVIQTMKDLRAHDVDILTIGQYLRPSQKHIELKEYVHPDQFKKYEEIGRELGFNYVVAGPLVRSSYKAGEYYIKNLVKAHVGK